MRDENSPPPPWRLLVADDHALIREGMQTMLAGEPDFIVVGEAENGLEALNLCRQLRPHLVLMDLRMPRMDGLEATRAIKEECPATSVLVVTTHESPEHLLDAVMVGAAGYILKDATKRQMLNAVRRVLSGESPLNQELAMRLIQRLTDKANRETRPAPESGPEPATNERRGEPLPEPLTARETEILRLLALGKKNREVAQDLRVSLSTVKSHIQHLIVKLGVADRTQAAVRAAELGLLPEREG